MPLDTDVLAHLIHTDAACISNAAIENEAYIKHAFFEKEILVVTAGIQGVVAELTAQKDEWNAKWLVASANTKAAIQAVIDANLSE